MLIIGSVKLFHNVILEHKPLALTQYLKQSMINVEGTRMVRNSFLKRNFTSSKTSKSLFHRVIHIYNSLPLNLKHLEPKIFNKRIKEIVRKTYSLDRVP